MIYYDELIFSKIRIKFLIRIIIYMIQRLNNDNLKIFKLYVFKLQIKFF